MDQRHHSRGERWLEPSPFQTAICGRQLDGYSTGSCVSSPQGITDPGVAADLDEIVRENLGWLDIQELPEHARTTALQKLANELVVDADGRMPPTVPERQHVLDYLGELAELSRRVIGETGGMSTRQA
jgi:hypothetical protein